MRVEPHGRGLRLTVTVNHDIEHRSTEQPRYFAEVSEAVAAVEEFLIGYEYQRP
ncbi:MAG: hypothetical protein ACRDRV_16190 [Pseudonocardiaceae bacterium]